MASLVVTLSARLTTWDGPHHSDGSLTVVRVIHGTLQTGLDHFQWASQYGAHRTTDSTRYKVYDRVHSTLLWHLSGIDMVVVVVAVVRWCSDSGSSTRETKKDSEREREWEKVNPSLSVSRRRSLLCIPLSMIK